MKSFDNKFKIVLLLLPALMLAACADKTEPSEENEAPALRIHDVSDLNVEELDLKLNDLLAREDLALRGQVELIDEFRLAVNGSVRLQREIASILDDLRNGPAAPDQAKKRPARIQFWLLTMSPEAPQQALPAGLDDVVEPIRSEFPGFEFEIQDFVEVFHETGSTIHNVRSGAGTRIMMRNVSTRETGLMLNGQLTAPGVLDESGSIQYQVNQTLEPGKALILGRAHGGGRGEAAVYQVLIARMEWID